MAPDHLLDFGERDNIGKGLDLGCFDDLELRTIAFEDMFPEELQAITIDLDGTPVVRLDKFGEVGL